MATATSTSTRTGSAGRSAALGMLLDAVLIVLFAGVGRMTHGDTWTGAFLTAWPFLLGAAVGWVAWTVLRRTPPVGLGGGVVVWVTTILGGMLLRQLTGLGTDPAFILVATGAVGLLLLGWRLIARLVRR